MSVKQDLKRTIAAQDARHKILSAKLERQEQELLEAWANAGWAAIEANTRASEVDMLTGVMLSFYANFTVGLAIDFDDFQAAESWLAERGKVNKPQSKSEMLTLFDDGDHQTGKPPAMTNESASTNGNRA